MHGAVFWALEATKHYVFQGKRPWRPPNATFSKENGSGGHQGSRKENGLGGHRTLRFSIDFVEVGPLSRMAKPRPEGVAKFQANGHRPGPRPEPTTGPVTGPEPHAGARDRARGRGRIARQGPGPGLSALPPHPPLPNKKNSVS